jgi:hypothetical protein
MEKEDWKKSRKDNRHIKFKKKLTREERETRTKVDRYNKRASKAKISKLIREEKYDEIDDVD